MSSQIRVLLVCRNRLLRESIARILSKKTEFEVESSSTACLPSHSELSDLSVDVVVLDSLHFLVGDATHAQDKAPLAGGLKCVLVAMGEDSGQFLAAIRYGVRGYVLQDASAVEVVSAIRTVAEGYAVCPLRYTSVLFDYIKSQTDQFPTSRKRARWGLTRREQQLIPLISRGLSNKEIASHLNLSEQTVKNHVHRILRKIGVSDRLSVSEVWQDSPVLDSAEGTIFPTWD